ncbi:MAG: glucose/sorbosone dehydrogenase [Thermoleophilia bacterium]|nr:glucose/sorbosone dehydrogenase [Thermoleophilia bacterium]
MKRFWGAVGAAVVVASVSAVTVTSQAATRATAVSGAKAVPAFRLAPLAPSFDGPTWIGGAGDGTSALLVAEQRGLVWRVAGGTKRVALDLRRVTRVNGEQGLLAVAIDSKFSSTHRVFVYLVLPTGVGQVRSYRFAKGRAVSGSGRVVLNVPLAPPVAANHNGGQLWSRADGTLWLSVGDGGDGGDPEGNGQDLGVLMGKLLRIRPKPNGGYTVPPDNPFVGRAGARGEILALGLRNPWRFSIDAPSGNVWIGDVGQGEVEEIDVVKATALGGVNFGWGRMEGNAVYNGAVALTSGTRYVAPRITYTHASGGCSVTGGVVYRGPVTSLRGHYLYADFCQAKVTAYNPTTRRSTITATPSGIVSFGVGAGGNVFAVSQQTGRAYRIAAK